MRRPIATRSRVKVSLFLRLDALISIPIYYLYTAYAGYPKNSMNPKPQNHLSLEIRFAKLLYRELGRNLLSSLHHLLRENQLSLKQADVMLLNGRWYVTHSGLLRLSKR